jgi:hypothetical protein
MDTAGVCAELLADSVVSSGDAAADGRWGEAYAQARDEAMLDWFHATVAGARDLSTAFD